MKKGKLTFISWCYPVHEKARLESDGRNSVQQIDFEKKFRHRWENFADLKLVTKKLQRICGVTVELIPCNADPVQPASYVESVLSALRRMGIYGVTPTLMSAAPNTGRDSGVCRVSVEWA